jgi:hypothetical protein
VLVAATTKQALVLFTKDDEAELAQAIASSVPEVKFLDFDGWRAADEPLCANRSLTVAR